MFDAGFIANPYPTYQQLLTNGRVHWVDYLGGAWLVPHYDDILMLLKDQRLSADRTGPYIQQFPAADQPSLAELGRYLSMWLLFSDGQDHLQLRRRLNKVFTPRMVAGLVPMIRRLTDELLDAALADGKDEIEIMRELAHPLPALVIMNMMGVRAEDRDQFMAWSDAIARFIGSAGASLELAYEAQDAMLAEIEYFRGVIAEHRARQADASRDDFLSLLLAAGADNLQNEAEILAQCTLFLGAGHETTRNLIGNGLLALLRNPDQLALLQRNPALIGRAIDEMVRYDSPVQALARVATEQIEIHGQRIEAGQTVLLLTGAGNRDGAAFPDPDRFDITRDEVRALSFGFGPHICIGKALAEMEAEIVFQALLQRLPNLQLASETIEQVPNFILRGLVALPVRGELQPEAVGLVDETPVAISGCPFHAAAAR